MMKMLKKVGYIVVALVLVVSMFNVAFADGVQEMPVIDVTTPSEPTAEPIVEEPVAPVEEPAAEQIVAAEPIVEETVVPENAIVLSELIDETNPDRSIVIYAVFEGDYLNMGDTVTLVSVLKGYEGLEYGYQWQMVINDEWIDIAGANGSNYSFTLTEDSAQLSWRVQVIVTAVAA